MVPHQPEHLKGQVNAVLLTIFQGGPAELLDCRDVMVDSDGPRVSVVGLEDVIVVIDKGEVLVTSSRGAANVGKLKGASGQ